MFVTLTMSITACGNNIKKQVIGKWKVVEVGMDKNNSPKEKNIGVELQNMLLGVVFQKGSTIEFTDKDKVLIMMNSVDYSWLDDKKIEIKADQNQTLAFEVRLKDDKMSFIGQNGIIINFERVK